MLYREVLQTDSANWVIGPYHGALPGPIRMRLKVDGEVIVAAQIEGGYLHRGLEKTLELHPWQSAVMYADHLDPEGAVFGELALCLAVEELCKLEVPPRAQAIRVMLSELTRVSSHMGCIVRVARAVGAETMMHYVLRDRERVLDLFELLAGARFSLNFLRYGGVSADVTEGFIERVLETCELIRIRLKEYNDLFSFNQAYLRRSAYIGVIQPELVRRIGISGPNARASAIAMDARKDRPYCGYERLDFEIPLGQGEGGTIGDAHDRLLLRLREIAQSLEILKQVADFMPQGEFSGPRIGREFKVPQGEAYVRVESSRGLLGCHVQSEGGDRPGRVQFRVPSASALMAVPVILAGSRIEDLPVILSSLDVCVAEVDR